MTQVTSDATSRDTSTTRQFPADVTAAVISTELGWVAVAHENGVVTGIVFGHVDSRQAVAALRRHLDVASRDFDLLATEDHPPAIVDLVARLTAFAAGESVDFDDVRIDQRHLTPFGRRIQQACRRIPRGETRSYGELAAAAGSAGAARAVGQAMARNRYPLVVPCHRVLASGGGIGGFSSPQGLEMKRRLLALESAVSN
jgi:methylated-DNA-[protein]-cysteine S-methyltransferase